MNLMTMDLEGIFVSVRENLLYHSIVFQLFSRSLLYIYLAYIWVLYMRFYIKNAKRMTYSHFTNEKCEGYKYETISRQAQQTTRTIKNCVV